MAIAEIISIGTELLLGQIVDTNSQYLSSELAGLGIDCLYMSTVGDNIERIVTTFKAALDRSDLVISTGGLGPTADDLTHESIARLFKAEMLFDQSVYLHIKSLFELRGWHMVESNAKQAYRPEGSQILPNPTGTAPGIIWSLSEQDLSAAGVLNPEKPRYVLTFPGVPSEMKRMWEESARSFLTRNLVLGVLWSQELKHYGIGESALAEKYADLLVGVNPSVAPLAGSGECRLRVSAKAGTESEARALALPVVEKIREGSGYLCYGTDKENLESVVAEILTNRSLTVAAAESCTGGLLSKRLTDIPGSSAYVKLNLVTYANQAKEEQLQVSREILDTHGAVSAECAEAMASGIRKLAGADIGLSITGIAGPDGASAEKPVGLVYFGLAANDACYVFRRTFPPQHGRDGIRQRSASEALNILRLYLLDKEYLLAKLEPVTPRNRSNPRP